MQVKSIHRKDSGFFSQQQVELVYNQKKYADFLNQPFSVEAFKSQIQQKQANYSTANRTVLVQAIQQQYAGLNLHEAVSKNLDKLALENTFTITTGHQLVAMTGPLYVIYKIGHVIQTCKELSTQYPEQNFVPVFWMATEDHDYEEIKSFHLFNRTISWETDQNGP
ncbi:MAG TPA: bacillithiol biosynthesis BshC, partial [Taishania sp.]|nr:bacillithiol biosynthesis BshC [Taishania sp.]